MNLLRVLRRCLALGLIGMVGQTAVPSRAAEEPRALAEGTLPRDHRLQPLKDLDGYFPFHPIANRTEWAQRSEDVRRQLRVALGLWPYPTRTPLQAVIHGRIDQGDYSVEKVYFESLPGFFVAGNLYRPSGPNAQTGQKPGVLCPHGHWENGRFYDNEKRVRQEIVEGAERFENGGRSPLQARCVQLARMGCVVFHYDMIGYADSDQLSFELAHRFAKQRPEMNQADGWGLFSPAAEAHAQSVMGLQTWNSMRALDFLNDLPDVDPQRIGVTGASGGGTQTFILCALDPRPTVAFPAVMVSTAMQGGCTCENASGLRVDTGNIEFAALFAPKPLGMTAANDWTKEMPSKGFPELKEQYRIMGAPNNVMLKASLHFDHNYNYVSRAAMYSWFNRHFQLGFKDPIVEEDYPRLSAAQLTVWDAQHPHPAGGPEFERKLLRWLKDDAASQVERASQQTTDFRQLVGGALTSLVGRSFAAPEKIEWELKTKNDRGEYLEMTGLLRNTSYDEELPLTFLHPKSWNGQTVIWLDDSGKAGLFDRAAGTAVAEVRDVLKQGATVVGIDLLFQGEFRTGETPTQTRRVKNPREAAAYTFGYNHPLLIQRVHDVLTLVKYVENHEQQTKRLSLVAFGNMAPVAALARAHAGDAIDRAVLDTRGFRFGALRDVHDPNFLPAGAKYGDLPGWLALSAPSELWLAGEAGEGNRLIKQMYERAGASAKLQQADATPASLKAKAVEWMSRP